MRCMIYILYVGADVTDDSVVSHWDFRAWDTVGHGLHGSRDRRPDNSLQGMILRHREHTGTSALRNIAKLILLNRVARRLHRIF